MSPSQLSGITPPSATCRSSFLKKIRPLCFVGFRSADPLGQLCLRAYYALTMGSQAQLPKGVRRPKSQGNITVHNCIKRKGNSLVLCLHQRRAGPRPTLFLDQHYRRANCLEPSLVRASTAWCQHYLGPTLPRANTASCQHCLGRALPRAKLPGAFTG